jgi:hypothetical protein
MAIYRKTHPEKKRGRPTIPDELKKRYKPTGKPRGRPRKNIE